MNKPFLQFAILLIALLASTSSCTSQNSEDLVAEPVKNTKVYINPNPYPVESLDPVTFESGTRAKNVILMIGDGMGLTQVYAGMVANMGSLHLQNCTTTGMIKTSSSDNDITDSAAAGTAMASGVKTYNGAIGLDKNRNPVKSILEIAEDAGKHTGLVATCRITHATPASFIAHQSSRNMYERIATDFLKTDIEVFIGGGRNNFDARMDKVNLLDSLRLKDYEVVNDIDSLQYVENGKLAALIHAEDQPPYELGRGEMLVEATVTALRLLNNNDEGFFLMIEGSQIDWGGHDNNTSYVVSEMLDFDRSIGEVLKFAAQDRETLVIITADHETGGFALTASDQESGEVKGSFTTNGHTGVLVPVYAYGPSAETFSGIYENTDIFHKMKMAAGFNE